MAMTLKVNPDDFKTSIRKTGISGCPSNASQKDVRVVADERIDPGGCFVETDSTSVSAHAHEMAERIDEELKKVFAAKVSPCALSRADADDPGIPGRRSASRPVRRRRPSP